MPAGRGAVMVYSASSARTLLEGQGDGTIYLVKYVAYAAVGLVVLQLLARGGLELLPRLTPALLAISFVLLVAVKVRASACRSTARSAGSEPGRCSSSPPEPRSSRGKAQPWQAAPAKGCHSGGHRRI